MSLLQKLCIEVKEISNKFDNKENDLKDLKQGQEQIENNIVETVTGKNMVDRANLKLVSL